MRPDLKDVIITRPRGVKDSKTGYMRHKFKKDLRRKVQTLHEEDNIWDHEDCPVKIRKDYSQSDMLSPLERAVKKYEREGKTPDEFYSDLCKNTDVRNVRGYHIRHHFFSDYCKSNSFRGSYSRYLKFPQWSIYNNTHFYRSKPSQKIFTLPDSEHKYVFHNDLWWRVKFKPYNHNLRITDVLLRVSNWSIFYPFIRSFSERLLETYNNSQIYCYWKQQANKKEIRKLNKLIIESQGDK